MTAYDTFTSACDNDHLKSLSNQNYRISPATWKTKPEPPSHNHQLTKDAISGCCQPWQNDDIYFLNVNPKSNALYILYFPVEWAIIADIIAGVFCVLLIII